MGNEAPTTLPTTDEAIYMYGLVPTDVWSVAEKAWAKHCPSVGKLLQHLSDVRHDNGSRDWYIATIDPKGSNEFVLKISQ